MIDKIFNIGYDFHLQFNYIEWIVGLITTFGLIYILRAKIDVNEIDILHNDSGELIRFKIPVINNTRYFAATNIIIETTLIKGNYTYHFVLDRDKFILIPEKCSCCTTKINERSFQTMNFDDLTRQLIQRNDNFQILLNEIMEENTRLRVRIHANHEFTNFGKAFEFNFKFKQGRFIKI